MPVRAMGATGTIGEAHNSEANKCRSTLELSCIMLAMLCFGLEWKIVTDSIEAEKRHDAAHENRRGRDASDSSGKGVMQECRPSNHGKEAYKVRWAGSE